MDMAAIRFNADIAPEMVARGRIMAAFSTHWSSALSHTLGMRNVILRKAFPV